MKKKTAGETFEYKLIQLELADNELMMAQVNLKARQTLDEKIEKKLCEYGKQGWQLHSEGLRTLPTIVLWRKV